MNAKGDTYEKDGKTLLGIIAVILICTMLMGMTAHAELFPKNNDFLTIYDISGKAAAPITSPRTQYTHYIGYALNYDVYPMTYTVSSNKKNVLLIKGYSSSVKKTIGDYTYDVPVRGITVIPNKTGTATFKVTFSDSSGLKRSASQTLRCYKWTNPFATLKIGKKSYKNAFKKINKKVITPIGGKLKIKMNSKYKKLRVYYAAKGKGFVKISKKAKVTLRSGDRLLFRFNDNKHRVKNEEAVLTVK